MNTSVITIKVESALKKKAQKVASEMGLSLSAMMNDLLKQAVRTKATSIESSEELELTEYAKEELRKSEEDYKAGRHSPGFTNVKDAIAWLDDPKRKYVYQLQQKVRKAVRKST